MCIVIRKKCMTKYRKKEFTEDICNKYIRIHALFVCVSVSALF